MYNLAVQGIAGLLARRVGLSRFMRRQPMGGLVNASNVVFTLPQYPCLSTISVYSGSNLVSAASYNFYSDTGVVQFYNAPSAQPTADYTCIQLTNQQLVYYVLAGFALMESMYSRGFLLSNSPTAYAMASPTDSAIYICQGPLATGGLPTDPVTGNTTFSASPIQRSWLERCAEYAYMDGMSLDAALSDVDVSERVGGVRINTSHRAPNIVRAKESMLSELYSAMYSALDETFSDGRHYGKVAAQQHSSYYNDIFQWQNNNGTLVPTGLGQWWQ